MSKREGLRRKIYVIIFEHDTPGGRAFDVALIIAILLSVVAVMLDSIEEVSQRYGDVLLITEWTLTLLFTAEYLLRLYSAPSARRYARSFFGVIDLLSILPTFISVLFPAGRFLLTVRVLRVLRVFRILKLVHFIGEAHVLSRAIRSSWHKIVVFVLTVLTIVVIVGSLMYLIEGEEAGFTSIPRSIYWAIVTLTTVGYGDIAPQSPLGQSLAALLMVTGYGVIAVPTGIVTVELGRAAMDISRAAQPEPVGRHCEACNTDGHDRDARFCKYCGASMDILPE